MPIDVRTRVDRFRTRLPWLDSSHCFSFGSHYDPANTHHGLLVVSNDDVVHPTSGFETHPHRDMEIVTWVLEGELEHKDTLGNTGAVYPGLAQRMSAGRGIWHSEKNLDPVRDVHFVQMWVLPDTEGIDPSYEQLDINPQLARGGLVPVASGNGLDAAIRIRQRHATLWAGRLTPGEAVVVPDARFAHVYLARGTADLDGAPPLAAGDAARLTDAGSPLLTAGPQGAEVLVWEMG
ncbi:MAG: pirin family protein [Acidimicrobiia bacterium]|nr:pirin family protein [Acidimicrobiia bacterium]